MDAKALFGILQTASNFTQRLAVAETIKDVVMDAMGNPTLAGTGISSHPEMVRELGKALSPLLDAALQARDWRTRDSLQDVDACSILLQAVSHHLECCSIAKLLPFLGENLFSCLRASGQLTSLPKALNKADSVLVAPNSPAPTDQSCTQYISFLLLVFSTLLRHTPNDCMHLQDGDLLAPLLLPAAQLAADVLRIYAGPDGARILASNTYLPGYGDARLVANIAVAKTVNVTPALVQHIGQQMAQEAGRIACSSVIANALRVADTFSIQAYNGCNFFMGPLADERRGPAGLQETALAKQVLGSHIVSRLVASMLFVMVKQLHTKQVGKAGVATPATRSSGRTKQRPSSSSTSALLVPAHHNQLANVLGLDLLAADEELFSDVTRQGPPPSWPGIGPIKAKLTPHNIDSTLVDPLRGLLAILLHVQENASPMMTMMQSTLLAAAKIRITAHLNDELSQAVLLTAAEVCALAPAEHGEDALRVSTLTGVSLFASWVRLAGLAVAGRFFGAETLLDWVDPSSNPLDRPELQELVTPVLRDLLVLLVPLLLPDCHGIPLPGSGSADPTGSKLSALLPQHIYLMVAAAGKDILAQLLEEHPLWTTRALEAALRVDWAERFGNPLFRSLLLRDVPAALTSLAQSGDATATSSSAARTAAGPSKLAALIASSSQRQLRLQVHALLTTVVKCAAGLNAKALRNAVAAAPAPAASGSSSSSSLRDAWTPPSSTLADRVGQFRGTLELINSAAAAAAALGRAVSQAAAGSSSTVPLTAPFVSLIGRCLHLTGTALEGASKEPQLGAAEFSSVSTTLATLLSCLHWVVADTACCRELLSSTGAADAAAVDSLRTSLQQQLAQLQGSGLQGLAVAAMLCDSGLAGQLQSVGGAMCGVVTGVCGNPACSSLSELSEIALVTPGGGKKGCGKCAACASVSYCSRGCQVIHWKQGHKVFCNACKGANSTAE